MSKSVIHKDDFVRVIKLPRSHRGFTKGKAYRVYHVYGQDDSVRAMYPAEFLKADQISLIDNEGDIHTILVKYVEQIENEQPN